MFKFKQFSIEDSNCGMKIGVDGVLLGAWIQQKNVKNILDVGTGSGLIALMLAQKHPKASIQVVEIEKEASIQAIANFNASKFNNTFKVYQEDFLSCEFDLIVGNSVDMRRSSKFDLIVSNLPYFNDGGIFDDHKRNLARSAKYLPLQDFIIKAELLLKDNGSIYFIYPSVSLDQIIREVKNTKLSLVTVVDIKGNSAAEAKRCLIKLLKTPRTLNAKTQLDFQRESITIEESRGEYTAQYKELCKDFYLKF
jgi:tRNA1Val (adenine37-N6)-methyltransferase